MAWSRIPTRVDGDVFTIALYNQLREALNAGVLRPIANAVAGVGGVASFDFQSIPDGYSDLIILTHLRSSSTAGPARVRFNNDSGANYDNRRMHWTNTTRVSDEAIAATAMDTIHESGSAAAASEFGSDLIIVPGYSSTAFQKAILTSGYQPQGLQGITGGSWRSAAAINRVTITPTTGLWAQYSRALILAAVH